MGAGLRHPADPGAGRRVRSRSPPRRRRLHVLLEPNPQRPPDIQGTGNAKNKAAGSSGQPAQP